MTGISETSTPVSVIRFPREAAPPPAERSGLEIRWSTGETIFLPGESLRRNCPCATCQELRGDLSHAKPLAPKKASLLRVVESTVEEATGISRVWPVGNYALGMQWSDGHDTGIFSFDLLRRLCNQAVEPEEE
jgi:DUF971 family protein